MAIFKRIIITFALLAAAASLWAQQPTGSVKVEFTVFAYGNLPQGVKFEASPGNVATLTFKSSERSQSYISSGGSSLVFFNEVANAAVGGPAVRTKVASAVIPADIKKALLFFVPSNAGSGSDPYRIIVMEDSLASFPAGSVRFFNASGLAFQGIFNDERAPLGAGLSKVFNARKPLKVGLAMQHNGRYYSSFEQEFDLPKEQRLICLLLPPESTASPLVRWSLISDYIPVPADVAK